MSDEAAGVGCLVVAGAIGAGLIYAFGGFDSRWRYAMQYHVDSEKVSVEQKLHDCEFMTAPIGDKHCHYKAKVETVMMAMSTKNAPIASYDGGQSWYPFTPEAGVKVPTYPTVDSVHVSWDKVNE